MRYADNLRVITVFFLLRSSMITSRTFAAYCGVFFSNKRLITETNIWRASYIRAVPVRVSKTSTIALGRKRDQNGKRKDIEACKQQGQGPAKKAIDGKKSS